MPYSSAVANVLTFLFACTLSLALGVLPDLSAQSYPTCTPRAAVTSTNRRVKWWSLIECLAVLAVSGLQVAFIKRLFNKPMNKRMV